MTAASTLSALRRPRVPVRPRARRVRAALAAVSAMAVALTAGCSAELPFGLGGGSDDGQLFVDADTAARAAQEAPAAGGDAGGDPGRPQPTLPGESSDRGGRGDADDRDGDDDSDGSSGRSRGSGGGGIDPGDFSRVSIGSVWESPTRGIKCEFGDGAAANWGGDPSYVPAVFCTVTGYQGEEFNVANCRQGISNLPYAAALQPGREAVRGICSGGQPFSGPATPPVLQYGQSVSSGDVECFSEDTGMTCLDSSTGKGFKIRKASTEMIGGDGTQYE